MERFVASRQNVIDDEFVPDVGTANNRNSGDVFDNNVDEFDKRENNDGGEDENVNDEVIDAEFDQNSDEILEKQMS